MAYPLEQGRIHQLPLVVLALAMKTENLLQPIRSPLDSAHKHLETNDTATDQYPNKFRNEIPAGKKD
ncbi:hypothetical protein N8563_00875 [bacterium]|nr:hypothetical protein [bacterium]